MPENTSYSDLTAFLTAASSPSEVDSFLLPLERKRLLSSRLAQPTSFRNIGTDRHQRCDHLNSHTHKQYHIHTHTTTHLENVSWLLAHED